MKVLKIIMVAVRVVLGVAIVGGGIAIIADSWRMLGVRSEELNYWVSGLSTGVLVVSIGILVALGGFSERLKKRLRYRK